MNWRLFFVILFTVFLAELGDKTQLAVITYTSTDPRNKWWIFMGASVALVLSTFIAVFLGATASRFLNPFWLQFISALLFIFLGVFLLFQSFREKTAYETVNEDLKAAIHSDCRQCPQFWEYMQHFQDEHHQRLSSHIIESLKKQDLLVPDKTKPEICANLCLIEDIHNKFHKRKTGGINVPEPGTKDPVRTPDGRKA